MTDEFKINVEWLEGSEQDPVDRATFGQIVISVGQQIATELEDLFARTIRPGMRAAAFDLAYWLMENWWRLRWEPESRTIDWRLCHVVAAVRGGVAWPNLCITSDGVHVLVESRSATGKGGAPVRYLRDLDIQVNATDFEAGVDEFVQRVLARLSSLNVEAGDLKSLWQLRLAERRDNEVTSQRRLEALLGFDPDHAPRELLASLLASSGEAGHSAVDEIAASARANAASALHNVLEAAKQSGVAIRIESAPSILRRYSGASSQSELPWQRAKRAAKLARDIWGIGDGPVLNGRLSELFRVPESFFEYTPANGLGLAAGLRTEPDSDLVRTVMRAKVPAGRRFEFMRLVSDHIVAPADDRLLPATSAKTDRQKFQRAFAQEFLLPLDELHEWLGRPRLGVDDISDDEIDDVAAEYQVSPRVVSTVLVNRGYLPRETLSVAG